jgi:hypothetical protein
VKEKQTESDAVEAQRCIIVTAAELYGGAAWLGERMRDFDRRQSLIVGGAVVALSLFAPGCATQRLRQAGDPATAPERLATFASKDDPRLTERVAANPSTPVATLLVLSQSPQRATAELAAANLAVHALAPETIAAMAHSEVLNQRLAVAYRSDTPAAILAALAADPAPAVRACVAANSAASFDLVLGLIDDADPQVAEAALGGPAIVKERGARLEELRKADIAAARLQALSAHRLPEVRAVLAAHAGLPAALRDRLIQDADPQVADAAYENASPDFLAAIAADRNSAVRARVAGHRKTPASVLDRLASDSDPRVRIALAGNTSAPHAILYKLSADADPAVRDHLFAAATPECLQYFADQPRSETRRRVAGIARTPEPALLKLAEDSDREVRREVLSNPSISPEVLAGLSDDADSGIRLAVAGNPSTPANSLQMLADDGEAGVRAALAGNAKAQSAILHRLAADENDLVRAAVAANVSSPATVLEILKADGTSSVRRLVAAHRNTFGQTLAGLLADPKHSVRVAVASNPSTPLDSLLDLLLSQDVTLARAAAGNASVSPENLVQYIKQGRIVSGEVLAGLSSHQSEAVRAAVGICSHAPLTTLDAMLGVDKSTLVQWSIAMNPSLSIELADKLIAGSGQLDKWEFAAGKPAAPNEMASYVIAALLNSQNEAVKKHASTKYSQRVSQFCSTSCTASCIVCTSCTGCTGCTSCTHCTSCTLCTVCTGCISCTSCTMCVSQRG